MAFILTSNSDGVDPHRVHEPPMFPFVNDDAAWEAEAVKEEDVVPFVNHLSPQGKM